MFLNVVNFLKSLHMEEATGRVANVKTISILSVNIVYSGDNFMLYIWIMLFHIYCCISQNHNSEVFIFLLCLHF
jgi:hypothetical protein